MNGKEAFVKLLEGNKIYCKSDRISINVSSKKRSELVKYGQSPIAVVITCSDSRVIPEAIFSSDIGELFVIREAGNVIGAQELGSIEYAVSHLGVSCVIVLGHDHCGAVEAALKGSAGGFIATLIDEIQFAIKNETNPELASCKNIKRQVNKLLDAHKDLQMENREIYIVGALYHQISGEVEILEEHAL